MIITVTFVIIMNHILYQPIHTVWLLRSAPALPRTFPLWKQRGVETTTICKNATRAWHYGIIWRRRRWWSTRKWSKGRNNSGSWVDLTSLWFSICRYVCWYISRLYAWSFGKIKWNYGSGGAAAFNSSYYTRINLSNKYISCNGYRRDWW